MQSLLSKLIHSPPLSPFFILKAYIRGLQTLAKLLFMRAHFSVSLQLVVAETGTGYAVNTLASRRGNSAQPSEGGSREGEGASAHQSIHVFRRR